MIEDALRARLMGFAGLSSIAGRVRPGQFAQNETLPALMYRRVSGVRIESLEGSSGLAKPVFQFDVSAKTYAEARAVFEQVRLCLQGFSGTVAGTVVRAVRFLGDVDWYFEDSEEHRVSGDFEVWHEEERPVFL